MGVVRPPDRRFGGATIVKCRETQDVAGRIPEVFPTGDFETGMHCDDRCWQAWGVPRVLVLDSYDSFVYNLVQYLGELGAEPLVYRNDELTVQEAQDLRPDGVLLSPGPGRPEDAGIICAAIEPFARSGVPVFGVCLGHQAIGHVFGGTVALAPELMHGKTSVITHRNVGVFAGIEDPVTATRYHSLIVDRASLPECLKITAETSDGLIMGVRHETLPIEGVQFHPESILTTTGHQMIRNFLDMCGVARR